MRCKLNTVLASGRAVQSLVGWRPPEATITRLHDFPRTIRPEDLSRNLSSQSARLREWIGAKRRVRREPSLGELTSAGANNSQATLYAANRPTMTAYRYRDSREWAIPKLCFAPSESSITRFKNNRFRK